MEKIYKIITYVLLLVSSALCSAAFHFRGHEYDRTPLGDAIDRASIKMLKEVYQASEDKNVISSPLGVLTLLSLYASGADGRIRDEIVTALGASNYNELAISYSGLSKTLSSLDPSYLTMANKVYVSDKFTLQDTFANTASRDYNSEVETIDFSNKQAAVTAINNWAERKSQGHIKNPVPDDAIDAGVAAALFNVIFFQGKWGVPFKAEATKEEDFHLLDKSVVKKPMMNLVSSFFYHEDNELGAKMIELPYKETGFRMVVVLPNEMDGLPKVMEKAQSGLLPSVFELRPAGFEIDLHMPKFNIDSSLDLEDILTKMGVASLFTDGASGVVKESPVKVSKAFQKAFVKVDEEGATAGAFTGFVLIPVSSDYVPPPPMPFFVDHPFLFMILQEDKVIFTGTYAH